MKRLLIISCSATKRPDTREMPAIERYDGPTYQCLRKTMREDFFSCIETSGKIISAKYGLIGAQKLIGNYDMKMTRERAAELRSEIQGTLAAFLKAEKFGSIFINLGKTYMLTLEDFDWGDHCLVVATGGIGMKTSQMKRWLTCS